MQRLSLVPVAVPGVAEAFAVVSVFAPGCASAPKRPFAVARALLSAVARVLLFAVARALLSVVVRRGVSVAAASELVEEA